MSRQPPPTGQLTERLASIDLESLLKSCPGEGIGAALEEMFAIDDASCGDELESALSICHDLYRARPMPGVAPIGDTPTRAGHPASAGQAPAASGELGRYRLLDVLGQGGMGVVYQAFDPELMRRLAVKVIKPGVADAQRLLREARLMANLIHPNIVTIHDIGAVESPSGTTHYIAMELIDGTSLRASLPQMKLDQRIRVLEQVARGVGFAHDNGVIHRDIKPDNVLIAEGRVLVTDFGLARSIDADDQSRLTQTGALLGTPPYMAPEQVTGRQQLIGPPTDVWALGVTLYQMLWDQMPFVATTIPELFAQIVNHVPAQRDVTRERRPPRDLRLVCAKALEKGPADRYPDATAFADEIARWRDGLPVHASPPSLARRLRQWMRRHPARATALLLLAVMLLAGLAVSAKYFGLQLREARLARKFLEQRDLAVEQRERAERALRAYDRMADVRLVTDLLDPARQPRWRGPQDVSALEGWLTQAEALLARAPAHRAELAALRARGREDAGGAWRFDTRLDRWRHQVLADLLAGIDRLPEQRRLIGQQLAIARQMKDRSIEQLAVAWREAVEAIARSPKYRGLRIDPQLGLAPLGADPASGLWEFVHLASGKAPRRGPRGWRVTPSTGIVLVLLPGGSFTMGSAMPIEFERPRHTVHVGPFFISKYEATQAQWRRLTGESPSGHSPEAHDPKIRAPITRTHPVERVSWSDCQRALGRVGLTLPTEAQWEYAARGGTSTIWWTGTSPGSLRGRENLRDRSLLPDSRERLVGWNDGYRLHAPVGSFAPNPFGLHDMVGNVMEWCREQPVSYRNRARRGDGFRAYPGKRPFPYRVARGGAHNSLPFGGRSASRSATSPTARMAHLGVRPARPLD